MADIFQEVDEEVRRERLKQIWDKYGTYILAVAVLFVLAVAGWRGYEWYQAKKAAEAGAVFESAVDLARQGKHAEAQAAFDQIASTATPGYRMLARFRAAGELALTDNNAAVKAYDALAADGSLPPTLHDLAALRAGLLLLDTASYDEVRTRLEPLAGQNRAFRHSAREALALSAWRAGDAAATRRWVDMMTSDPETPASTRARVDVLLALLAGTGKT